MTGSVPVHGLHGAAEGLIDGVVADSAEIVAEYRHPHFSRWPAVTTRTIAQGRVTVLGTVPDAALAESLGRWIAAVSPAATRPAPFQVDSAAGTVAHSAINAAGRRIWFVHRLADTPDELQLDRPMRDVLSGVDTASVELTAWDVRILEEAS